MPRRVDSESEGLPLRGRDETHPTHTARRRLVHKRPTVTLRFVNNLEHLLLFEARRVRHYVVLRCVGFIIEKMSTVA